METDYTEREATPQESRNRGEVLDSLADGAYWAFLMVTVEPTGTLSLKVEVDNAVDTDTLKAMLEKTLEALP